MTKKQDSRNPLDWCKAKDLSLIKPSKTHQYNKQTNLKTTITDKKEEEHTGS